VGTPLTTTLGLVQRLLPDARDGWDLALDRVPGTGDDLLPRLRRLGEVIGAMHRVLASEPDDPGFAPEEPTPEAAALLATRVDEQIEVVFADLPDDDAMAPIHGRSEDARTLVRSLGPFTSPGRAIRIHGDLHLAQALWSGDDWSIIDFEGEPARSVAERRMKSLPLRDVAGMFRSFSYAAWAMEARGTPPPPRWEERAREEFLGAYRDSVGGTGLVPDDEQEQHRFLQLFELDKALYELRYEREHRPEWVGVPARAIGRLIDGRFA
jgi:trehalose synthase-fused probable maltokinase